MTRTSARSSGLRHIRTYPRDMTGRGETSAFEEVPSERAQVWPQFRMQHGISVAWLGEGVSAGQMYGLEDAWDLLVVHARWRDWKRTYLHPEAPFLYMAVRDGITKRRLLKTKTGVSMQLPTAELTEAEAAGTLLTILVEIIRDIYGKWAEVKGYPAPPELPPLPSGPQPADADR